ncbi:cyclin-like protein [Durotheca rogersii]|uniref:cyclin-like protein n=1 Tax=Durotheca rogersii TaxID=419775 RepID=UPI002220771D|nr:cyclin-like protein [Durotheca rogersii]KAI5862945.1 cyclin-like protein [Durotheca rogersii]
MASQPNKTLHQRHKSAGNLLNMATTSSLSKVPVRRAGTSDTGVGVRNSSLSTETIAREQENRGFANPKEAFLRPAQRPPNKSVAPSVTANHLKTTNQSLPPPRQLGASKRRTPLVVFNDGQTNKENQGGNPKGAKLIAQSSSDKAVLVSTTTKDNNSQPQSTELEQDWVTVNTEQALTETVQTNMASAAGEEIPEALYLDAVEELSAEKYPVVELEKLDVSPMPSPDVTSTHQRPPVDPADYDAMKRLSASIFKRSGHPIPPDLLKYADLSDCEDEDYYDEQGYTTAHSYRSRGDYTTGGATTVMLPPELTKKGEAELEAAREIVESKRIAEEDEEDELFDISMVTEYGDEIFQYMREIEMTLLPDPRYMDTQTELQWSMRAVLMDWVIQVHTRFGLLPETLFSAVNFIDRFLSVKIVSLGKLQLVGATALFLAAKYEEINCPSVQEVVYMVDGAYTFDEILKAERFMLSMLDFALGWPGPMSFLRRISKADKYDNEIRTVAKYFLEVALMDERFVASPPSYVAAGSHCLSRMVLGKGDWTPEHVHYSGYTYTQLKPFVAMILECCRDPRKHHHAVFEKYKVNQFRRASTYVEQKLLGGFRLPFQKTIAYHSAGDWDDEVSLSGSAVHHPLRMPIPLLG